MEHTMHYDKIGRPTHQRVRHNGQTLYDKSYTWGDNLCLLQTFDTINRRSVRYDYDAFGSLSGAVYGDGSRQWRNPDAMGNVYDSPDRTDRSYGRGGQLRKDKKWRYYYDSHGNLVLKTMRRMEPSHNAEARDEFLQWQSGDYAYTWQGNDMLRSVTRPDDKTVTFKYDALGRRIEKVFDGRVYRYLWDGDVILHEWDYTEADRPNTVVTETDEVTLDRPEPVENLITRVYDSDSYVPTAKIVGDRHYSIISDYIGRPVQAYDDNGNVVWQTDCDIYGNLRNLHGCGQFIPFHQLGQDEDEETGLYYNRFRYYDPNTGTYISQAPIGLAGNNPTLYGYVGDCNKWTDMFGLDMLALPAPTGKNPWESGEIVSTTIPKGGLDIEMAMSPGQTRPGGWATTDKITDVDFVRNKLAVTPEFKPEISHVQKFHNPEGERFQIGTVRPQTDNGIIYEGGGNQIQILIFEHRAKIEPIGKPRKISYI